MRFEVDFEEQCRPEKKRTEDLYAVDFEASQQQAEKRLDELIGYGVFNDGAYVGAIRGGWETP